MDENVTTRMTEQEGGTYLMASLAKWVLLGLALAFLAALAWQRFPADAGFEAGACAFTLFLAAGCWRAQRILYSRAERRGNAARDEEIKAS